jgi:predicted metal-dependent phosphoesterase TrpH
MPRPMAGLEAGPNIIAIDFHTHTRFSHDGRPDWTPEDVRAWHRAAGFGAAYITDHRTFEGARDGWSNNPGLAGENTVLLPAIEVVWRGEHVNVLDADRMYRGILTSDLRDIDEQALNFASAIPNAEPVLIETIPGDLSKVVAAAGPRTAGVRAIEIVDGAPKGLGQSRRERLRIIKYADSLNLAPVAGSDSHGWGHTASAWTLMFIPNWRAQSPEQLSTVISTTLRRGGSGSTKVAERYVANTDDAFRLPFTVPLVTWGMMRTLTTDERVVWLVWTAILYVLWRVRRARRTAQALAA